MQYRANIAYTKLLRKGELIMKYRYVSCAAICIAAALLAGCSDKGSPAADITDITSAAQSGTVSEKGLISLEAAENAALAHAGIDGTEAKITKTEFDRDNGGYEYEIEFTAKNYKYEYDINAEDGSVINFSKEAVPEKIAETAAQTSQKSETNPVTKNTEASRNDTATSAPAQTAASPAEKMITAEEAKSAALNHAGLTASEVTFTKTELDYDDGVAEYDVEFYTSSNEYEYEIKASDGMVIKYSKEALELPAMKSSQTVITAEEAKAAALEYAGLAASDVRFTKAGLDYDDGAAEYEIEFRYGQKEYEFKIDAYSGEILEIEIE